MADKKRWMFGKTDEDESQEKTGGEMGDRGDGAGVAPKPSQASAEEAGLRDVDATCVDCQHLGEDQTSCSKVTLPANFSAMSFICSKFFSPKGSNASSDETPETPAPAAPTA